VPLLCAAAFPPSAGKIAQSIPAVLVLLPWSERLLAHICAAEKARQILTSRVSSSHSHSINIDQRDDPRILNFQLKLRIQPSIVFCDETPTKKSVMA
jgi:hypothetical protein